MKVDVLLGLQWGDEGKGKIVDVLTPNYKVIARFQGGPNAGHTLEFENQKYVLRSIPSGIFQGGKINLIDIGVLMLLRIRAYGLTKLLARAYDIEHIISYLERSTDGSAEIGRASCRERV